MISQEQVIEDCKKKVLDDDNITENEIDILFNLDDSFLKNLSDAANEITRFFQGKKVDVEQLTNIKKNFCSEDCSFCSQSAFFNTKIDNYKLQPSKEILKQYLGKLILSSCSSTLHDFMPSCSTWLVAVTPNSF